MSILLTLKIILIITLIAFISFGLGFLAGWWVRKR